MTDSEDQRRPPGGDATTYWTFRWRGGPFELLGVVDGKLKGVYTGGSWGFADSFQLTPEPAPDGRHQIYTLTVDRDAVTDLTEHRRVLPEGEVEAGVGAEAEAEAEAGPER